MTNPLQTLREALDEIHANTGQYNNGARSALTRARAAMVELEAEQREAWQKNISHAKSLWRKHHTKGGGK